MHKYIEILYLIIKNKIFFYIFSRYITYFIQFINSLLIAVFLGPVFLGIWGFFLLVCNYLSQMNFGISHSVNAIVSINKSNEDYSIKIFGSSIVMLIALSFILGLLFFVIELFDLDFGQKYGFHKYSLAVYLIVVFGFFNSLLVNVFRIYGKVFEIALQQSFFPILTILSFVFFKGENLLWSLITLNLLSVIITFIILVYRSPVSVKLNLDFKLIKLIQIKGWHLFLYNTSFYLIIISTRFFISGYYSVKEFGYFTFVFSMANAILLLLDAISFLVFPKMLNRFASDSDVIISRMLKETRNVYITLSHGLIHLLVFMSPFFFNFFSQYKETVNSLQIIALTIVLYTNSFGYQSLLIARGKEKILGKVSFFALSLNIALTYFFINYVHVKYNLAILGTLLTYFFYVFYVGFLVKKLLKESILAGELLASVFPYRFLVPYLCSLIIGLWNFPNVYNFIPLIIFLVCNITNIKAIFAFSRKILVNPNFVDV